MKKLTTLIELVKPFYNSLDPAHDWAHIERVAKTAKVLAEASKANTEITLAAVYCHDLVNLPKNHPERDRASTLAAEKATPLLRAAEFSKQDILLIQKAVTEHSFSKGMHPSCLEAEIVQDADRLDALGAIGVLRCASVNTQMKSCFYHSNDPLAQKRELNDKNFMLDHYFVKLFKLPELMNTELGKEFAIRRVEFMKSFIEELIREIR